MNKLDEAPFSWISHSSVKGIQQARKQITKSSRLGEVLRRIKKQKNMIESDWGERGA